MHATPTDEPRVDNVTNGSVSVSAAAQRMQECAQPSITRAPALAYVASLLVAVLIAVVSAVGLTF